MGRRSTGRGEVARSAWVRAVLRISPRAFVVGAVALITPLALAGALTVHRGGGGPFDLDGELTIPAFASALLLCLAGAAALAAHAAPGSPGGRAAAVLAALFAVMAVDELASVHESAEDAFATDWQTLYVPVIGIAALAWLLLLARLRGLERAVLAGGALCWALAQLLEALQWEGPRERERAVDGYGILMGFEELLEMCGSAMFALAILLALRRWAARDG